MQLLVFAHKPPPVHGQSLMVQTLVEGLPAITPDLKIFHLDVRLSTSTSDVGHWRFGKVLVLLYACIRALGLRLRNGPMNFYYVPAPGRRAPLYRDWIVMMLCRPFFRRLILHWHGIGLGAWLTSDASPLERWITQRLLGHADLAIVLAPELVADAQALAPRKVAVVRNGIADPGAESSAEPKPGAPTQVLFVGLCTAAKGIFDTLAGVSLANQREPNAFRLVVAGGFANRADREAFQTQAAALPPGSVHHVGFADDRQKHQLLADADVFCFPTTHPFEGQPLSLIEALAHDLPIITTRWRAIPGMLPTGHVSFVNHGQPDEIADALIAWRHTPPRSGARRQHYLEHFTRERHLSTLAAALTALR
jgi:glycosyltransferase involved in cell wall biosynthesis